MENLIDNCCFIVYTDESGNTGENLFDTSQPYFWTGTLVSLFDIDNVVKHKFDKLCK